MGNQDVTDQLDHKERRGPKAKKDAMVTMEKRGTLGPKEKLDHRVKTGVKEKKEKPDQLDPRAIWDRLDVVVTKVSEVTLDQRVTPVLLGPKACLG
jgi:hypothetical protein